MREFDIETSAFSPKNQREVATLQEWHDTDEKAAERSRRLRNMLGGVALAGYGILATAHLGEGVPLSDLTVFSAGLGVLMNSASRKHGDAVLNEKMAQRSTEQIDNIIEDATPALTIKPDDDYKDFALAA